MENKLTYQEAYTALEKLVSQLEEDGVPLDVLAEKVKQANELIAFCEKKLRVIETDVNETIAGNEVKPK